MKRVNHYIYDKKRIFVSQVPFKCFATVFTADNGRTQRLVRSALRLRYTFYEAQADLDKWAEKEGLIKIITFVD